MKMRHSAKNKDRRNNLLPPKPVYPPSMQREMAEKELEDTQDVSEDKENQTL